MVDQVTPRRCDKPSCGQPAAAGLSFRYDTGEVWLHDLADEPHPSRYDLCQRHAGDLTVPRGWQLVDERTASVHSIAPPAEAGQPPDQVAVGGGSPDPGGPGSSGPRGPSAGDNRYAQLSAELPRLAAEVGAHPPGEAGHDADAGARGFGQSGAGPVGDGVTAGRADGAASRSGEAGDPPGAAGDDRPTGPPATSRGLTPADVPGGGGVVLDFFDRSREREGRPTAEPEGQGGGSDRRGRDPEDPDPDPEGGDDRAGAHHDLDDPDDGPVTPT